MKEGRGAGRRIGVSLQYDPPGAELVHAGAALMDTDAGARCIGAGGSAVE
jgi:hypothetical protein